MLQFDVYNRRKHEISNNTFNELSVSMHSTVSTLYSQILKSTKDSLCFIDEKLT